MKPEAKRAQGARVLQNEEAEAERGESERRMSTGDPGGILEFELEQTNVVDSIQTRAPAEAKREARVKGWQIPSGGQGETPLSKPSHRARSEARGRGGVLSRV